MENAPVPKNENQTDEPFDFSKYSQPEVDPVKESATESPFDFSKYNQPESTIPVEQPTQTPFDFSEHQDGQKTIEEVTDEINEHNRLTKTYDFSNENIAAGGPIQRELTPAEIYENGKQPQVAENLQERKSKFGGDILRKLLHRK